MTTTKHLLDLKPRPKLRLCEIERLVRTHRIVNPLPSRRFFISLCEDGTFETAPRTRLREQYLVYEDSFLRWVESLEK